MKMWKSSERALTYRPQAQGHSVSLQRLSFPMFTARPDLPKEGWVNSITRMSFHQGSFQHKRSSYFLGISSTSRNTAGRLSTCLQHLTFRKKVSISGTGSHGLEKSKSLSQRREIIPHCSAGKGDLQPMLDREKVVAAI